MTNLLTWIPPSDRLVTALSRARSAVMETVTVVAVVAVAGMVEEETVVEETVAVVDTV